MPRVLVYVLIFIGIGVVSSVLGIINPFVIIGNMGLEGWPARIYFLLIGILLMTCFYGIIKKESWAYKLTINWYILHSIILLFNFVMFVLNMDEVISLKQAHNPEHAQIYTSTSVSFTMFSTFLLGVVFALFIIVNLYRNKDYFNK
ncbi:MAG: hypothetical protein WCL14_04285 [Bacteroidota bacterium]